MRDYLTRLLANHWNTELARDGDEALQLARHAPPDLVVPDVMMPGLDGFGLLSALRAVERLASNPVILLTARPERRPRSRGSSPAPTTTSSSRSQPASSSRA
jgi:CheY-like chemotaxis protein